MTIAKSPYGMGMVAALLFTGCVIESPGPETDGRTTERPGDGIVEVSWLVGASGCEANGVTEVQLVIGDIDTKVACDIGTTRIQLEAGDYSLSATGLDAKGVARFDAVEPLVSIFEEETTTLPPLRLSARPASLTMFWRFENGSLCGANGVDTIDVALFSNEELVEPFPSVVDCDPGEATFEDISAGTYTVDLVGLDEAGASTFRATSEIELFRGENAEYELELTPIDDGQSMP